jgi:hypothetical protein
MGAARGTGGRDGTGLIASRDGSNHRIMLPALNREVPPGDQRVRFGELAVGWSIVAAIVASLLAAAIWLVRKAARRWWDYLVILLLTAAFVPFLAPVTGDMSMWLPQVIWSDGPEGKDQIIVVSAASSILVPLLLAAGLFWVVSRIIGPARATRVD